VNGILAPLLILATIALVILKVTGVLAIGWVIAFLPLIVLGGLLVLALVFLILAAIVTAAASR
jgi:hypothetical protein